MTSYQIVDGMPVLQRGSREAVSRLDALGLMTDGDDSISLFEFCKALVTVAREHFRPDNTKEQYFAAGLGRATDHENERSKRIVELSKLTTMLQNEPTMITPQNLMSLVKAYTNLECWTEIIELTNVSLLLWW